MHALRSLVKHDSVFEWNDTHSREWQTLCSMLTTALVLAISDPKRKTRISADASIFMLGATLLQRHNNAWRPVVHTSRVLSEAGTRYAQIEKDAFAITFGCKRFREFVCGYDVSVETDQRPLLTIVKKSSSDAPPHLKRFFLLLLQFDFTLQYVPGKELLIADTLVPD